MITEVKSNKTVIFYDVPAKPSYITKLLAAYSDLFFPESWHDWPFCYVFGLFYLYNPDAAKGSWEQIIGTSAPRLIVTRDPFTDTRVFNHTECVELTPLKLEVMVMSLTPLNKESITEYNPY